MSRARLQQISATVFAITSGREKIGQVVRKHDGSGFYGRMQAGRGHVESTLGDATAVFHDLVTKANRIALCGRDDAQAAREALEKRNAEVLKAQAAAAADPIMRDIAAVAQSLGIPFRLRAPRVRSRRISI